MPQEKWAPKKFKNPPEVDPETGVVLTEKELRERLRKDPEAWREQK